MESERDIVQGNKVLSFWKYRQGHRRKQRHGCLMKHVAS